jgi:hypothetical protein
VDLITTFGNSKHKKHKDTNADKNTVLVDERLLNYNQTAGCKLLCILLPLASYHAGLMHLEGLSKELHEA